MNVASGLVPMALIRCHLPIPTMLANAITRYRAGCESWVDSINRRTCAFPSFASKVARQFVRKDFHSISLPLSRTYVSISNNDFSLRTRNRSFLSLSLSLSLLFRRVERRFQSQFAGWKFLRKLSIRLG